MTKDSDNINDLITERHNLLFDIRRSARYHNRRRMFFDRQNKWADAMTAILGSSTIVSLIAMVDEKAIPILFGALTAILSALNLVFDTKSSARLHHDLARDFIKLEKFLVQSDLTGDVLREAAAKRLDIEVEEPPVLRVLDLLCHNELVKSMGYEITEQYNIGWWRAMFCQVIDFFPSSIIKHEK